jgi:hypothetical protein
MQDRNTSNDQLMAEVAALRRRMAELEALQAERGRTEQVQSALYRIADAANAATEMPEFYGAMHWIVRAADGAASRIVVLRDATSCQ